MPVKAWKQRFGCHSRVQLVDVEVDRINNLHLSDWSSSDQLQLRVDACAIEYAIGNKLQRPDSNKHLRAAAQ